MNDTDQYNEWDLTPLPIPPRSTLYALQPIGMGTSLVESLSSYITRLAEAHCVFSGSLVQKVIVPLVPGYSPVEQHGLFRESGDRSTLMNGAGLPALYTVQALEALTRRSDLRNLTLLPLSEALTVRSFIRLTKAWCPMCYEEWRANDQVIYDPLLWTFREISLCMRHECPLHIYCPYQNCGKALPAVGWRSRLGYCSYCQRWLGTHTEHVQEPQVSQERKSLDQQQWLARTLSEVLALMTGAFPLPERGRARLVVKYVVEQISGGNIAVLARSLGLSVSLMHYWCRGERIPEINTLLHFCYYLDLSFDDFLFEKLENLHPLLKESTRPALPTSKKKDAIDPESIYQTLEMFVRNNEQPPPTLREVQQQVGYHMTLLYKINTTACNEIVARRKAYIQWRKKARLQQLEEEITQVALQLRVEGIAPTQKRIAPYLSHPGILRNPQMRQHLRKICQEAEQNA